MFRIAHYSTCSISISAEICLQHSVWHLTQSHVELDSNFSTIHLVYIQLGPLRARDCATIAPALSSDVPSLINSK